MGSGVVDDSFGAVLDQKFEKLESLEAVSEAPSKDLMG